MCDKHSMSLTLNSICRRDLWRPQRACAALVWCLISACVCVCKRVCPIKLPSEIIYQEMRHSPEARQKLPTKCGYDKMCENTVWNFVFSVCDRLSIQLCGWESLFGPSGPIKNRFIYKVTIFQLLVFCRNPLSNSTAHLLFTYKMTCGFPPRNCRWNTAHRQTDTVWGHILSHNPNKPR